MKEVKVWKASEEEIKEAKKWPTWSKEESVFDWYYDEDEQFYVVEGEVEVTLEDGKKIQFGPGDMVKFPAGTRCIWHVKKPIFKHYRIG